MPKLDKKKEVELNKGGWNEAVKKFRSRGFSEMESPEFGEPRMPQNITSLRVTDLGNLMSKYAAWREYADEQTSIALTEFTFKKKDYDFEYAKEYITLPSVSKETEKSKERKLLVKSNIKKLLDDLTQAEMFMELLSAKQESYNNAIFVISREFTRRGQVMEVK